MATVTVSPIHFEDYSGLQFERLIFAYHVRVGWRNLIWHGQSGGGTKGGTSRVSSPSMTSRHARPSSNAPTEAP